MKRIIYLGLSIISAIFILSNFDDIADAKYVSHNETPTEIRGNWYQYFGNNKWEKLTINKKEISSTGYYLNKHWKNLSINKTNAYLHKPRISNYGYPNFSYDIDYKNSDNPSPDTFFLSIKKYNGKKF